MTTSRKHTPAPGDARAARPKRVLRGNRDFALLWSGQVVSALGTRVSMVAFPLLVIAMTHSPAKAGLAGFCATLPYALFYLPAGALLDRLDRRRVMLACEAGRFLTLGSIPLAAWLGRLSYPHLLCASFLSGTFFVFFSVAEKSIVPSLVPGDRLPQALAALEARSRAAGLAGPPLAGLLYGIAHTLPFAADALSYAVSFTTTFLIRTDLTVRREHPSHGLLKETRDGIAWLVREPFIRTSIVLVGAINVVFQALVLTFVVLTGSNGGSGAATGLVLGCYGVGGLAGALAAPRLSARTAPGRVAIAATWAWALLLLPLALSPATAVLCLLAAVIAFAGPLWNVALIGHQYRLIPDHLLARVKSVVLMVSWGTIPLGSLVAGYLLDQVGTATTAVCLTVVMAAIAATATASPAMRHTAAPA